MRRQTALRALMGLGMATMLASAPGAAIAQASNPLGVEWVGGDKTRAPTPPNGGEANMPTPPPPATNPLGVEWAGGGKSATAPSSTRGVRTEDGSAAVKPSPPPPASNPLGVEWVGGSSASAPPPSTTGGIRTDGEAATPEPSPPPPPPPAPQTPVRPQPGAEAPLPQTGTGQQGSAAALIDTWLYRAVAFSGPGGTVSETSSVSGTLKFKPDGAYEQVLSIGGIANVIKGRYHVIGDRLETTYMWRAESVTDAFDFYLDPTAKHLTLAGRGSPKAHYTLQRAE